MEEPAKQTTRFSITHLSLLIALASFGEAAFQGYLNSRNIEIVQRDIARREQIRACKEAIESFFDTKLRIMRLVSQMKAGAPADSFDASMSVSRFGAIGTYLANFQGEDARYKYTLLTRELQKLVDAASAGGANPDDAFFKTANEKFDAMNADCIQSAKLNLK